MTAAPDIGLLLLGNSHVLDQHRTGFDIAAVIDVVGDVDDMLKHVLRAFQPKFGYNVSLHRRTPPL